MAKIVGAAGAYAGKQSVAAFKKMFATVLIVVAVIAFAEGVMLTSLVTLRGSLILVSYPGWRWALDGLDCQNRKLSRQKA